MDRSWMPTAAGVLNIISGCFCLMGALALIFAATMASVVPEIADEPDAELPLALVSGLLWALVLLSLALGAVAVVGGVVALRRSGWGWPLAGAVAAFFAAMPLGLLALIFVVLAEKELRPGAPPPPQTAAAA